VIEPLVENAAPKRTLSGTYSIIIAALLWSTGGLFIKEVSLDAWSISLWRSLFGCLTIFAIYRFNRKRIEAGRTEPWFTPQLWITSFFFALLLVLFVIATKLTTSANAIFLQYTAPIYVLFAEPILSHTKLKPRDLAMVFISTCAMALFFLGEFDVRSLWGNVAALTSGVAFATFALLLKHKHASEALRWRAVIVGHGMIVLAMTLLAIVGITNPMFKSASDFSMLVFLGMVQIGIAYTFFTFGIGHVRAIDATLICMIEPVLNPIWVYIGMGEKPTPWAILGGGIILSVVAIRTIFGDKKIAVVLLWLLSIALLILFSLIALAISNIKA
jgi:drug/metabolite transporter (DMT)-like permease